jgi:membrane fusion protein (multidrug efflux system)
VSRSKRSSTLGSPTAGYCRLGLLRGHRHSTGNEKMDSVEDKVAIVTGGSGVVVARLNKRKMIGLLLCLSAVVVLAAGCAWASAGGETSTDNAYVRGDVTSLAPKVAGYIIAVEVEDNQTVRAGDVLFRIDDRDYRARLAEAVANVEAAQARLSNVDAETQLQHALIRQAEAQKLSTVAELNLAARASDRRRELIRSSAVSQAQVDESDAARSRAEAGVSAASAAVEAQQQRIAVFATQRDAAVAAVAQARAARDLAQIDLDSTVVRAPVDGVVGNRQVRVGRLVAPGASLLDIVPVDNVWIVANFKETQLEHIRPGQRVRITVDGYPNERFEGVVDSFAPGSGSAFSLLPSDNATGNFVRVVQRVPVKIRFAGNPLPGRLVPGLSARVEIDRGSGSARTKTPSQRSRSAP